MVPTSPSFLALDWNGTVVPLFGCPAYPHALQVLEDFQRAGMSLFVVSHATQAQIETDVRRIGLAVNGVFGCSDKGPVLSDLRLQYGVGWVLGDHPADSRAAAEADLAFVQACLEGQAPFAGQRDVFRHWLEVPTLFLAGRAAER